MKKYIVCLVALMATTQAFAQQQKKEKEKSKEGENINETIDKGINEVSKAFDGLFKTKKTDSKTTDNKAVENTQKSTENPANTENANTSSDKVNDFFKNLTFDTKPSASYLFSSSYIMKITFKDNKNQENVMKTKYLFSDNGETVGSKIISSSNADMEKSTKAIDMTIIDLKQSAVFTFMNNDGKKNYMGVAFKENAAENKYAEKYKNTKITATGKTKTIAGYVCDGYLMQTEEGENINFWISQRSVAAMSKFNENLSKMAQNQRFGANKNPYIYNQNSELMAFAKQGRVSLGMDWVGKKGEQMSSEVEQINASDSSTFGTAGYASMMGR